MAESSPAPPRLQRTKRRYKRGLIKTLGSQLDQLVYVIALDCIFLQLCMSNANVGFDHSTKVTVISKKKLNFIDTNNIIIFPSNRFELSLRFSRRFLNIIAVCLRLNSWLTTVILKIYVVPKYYAWLTM